MPNNLNPFSVVEAFSEITEFWSPQVIAEVNDSYVKVAKLKGTFVWHKHDDEDELFWIIKGRLRIQFQDREVELQPGDIFVVPRGEMHNPIADDECHVVLFERKSTQHTGDNVVQSTKSVADQLKSFRGE
ncbi:MAG: cupin domain-containing protein [Pirellulaceae bacterium]